MSDPSDIGSHSLRERVVLLALAEAALEDDAPVASVDVRPRCETLLDRVEVEVISGPREPEIMRALSALGAEPYVREVTSERSPAGKGRPSYDLAVETDAVLDVLAADDRLEDAVEFVRGGQ